MPVSKSYLKKPSQPKPEEPQKAKPSPEAKPVAQTPRVSESILPKTEPLPEPINPQASISTAQGPTEPNQEVTISAPVSIEAEPTTVKPSRKIKLPMRKLGRKFFSPWTVLIVIVLASITSSVLLFYKLMDAENKFDQLDPKISALSPSGENPQAKEIENEQVVEALRKVFVFPGEEIPSVATIVDVAALRAEQPFFNSAQNGDKLVVFSEKAILYRPTEKKIVDIGPVNRTRTTLNPETNEATPSANPKP